MRSDDDKLTFADRIVLELLNGMISNDKHFIHYEIGAMSGTQGANSDGMEEIIRTCYKIADLVRKVRLSAFE